VNLTQMIENNFKALHSCQMYLSGHPNHQYRWCEPEDQERNIVPFTENNPVNKLFASRRRYGLWPMVSQTSRCSPKWLRESHRAKRNAVLKVDCPLFTQQLAGFVQIESYSWMC